MSRNGKSWNPFFITLIIKMSRNFKKNCAILAATKIFFALFFPFLVHSEIERSSIYMMKGKNSSDKSKSLRRKTFRIFLEKQNKRFWKKNELCKRQRGLNEIYLRKAQKFWEGIASHAVPLSLGICKVGIKKIWKLVEIFLALIIFYKMNTNNDVLLKFWYYLVV